MEKIQVVSILDKFNNFICHGILFRTNNIIAPAHVNHIVDGGVDLGNGWVKIYPIHVDIKHVMYFVFKKATFEVPIVYPLDSFTVYNTAHASIVLYPYKVQFATGKSGYHVKSDPNIFYSGMPFFNSQKQLVGIYIWKSPYLAILYTDFSIPDKPVLKIPEGIPLPKLITLNDGKFVFAVDGLVKKLIYRSEYPIGYIQLPTTCPLVKFNPEIGPVKLKWIDKRPDEIVQCTEFKYWFYFEPPLQIEKKEIQIEIGDLDEKIIASIQKCPPLTVLTE